MFRLFYSMSPKFYRNWMDKHIDYCNFSVSSVKLINFFVSFSILIAAVVSVFSFILFGVPVAMMALIGVGAFFVSMIVMHAAVMLIADSRANFVDTILPDALQIISANLRSGLTPDKAILTSARPEFGPLEIELKKVSKETISGIPFEDSLKGITRKIKSKVLKKTVNLLVEGLEKGGSLTTLLDSVSEDIRQSKLLKDDIKSYVMMYGIFIFFAASIGAPILYSVSTYMVETLTVLGNKVDVSDIPTTNTAPLFSFEPSKITLEFLLQYSSVAILVTSIFGAMLIGLIQEGSEKGGLKYIPILLGVSFGIYFGSQFVLRTMLALNI